MCHIYIYSIFLNNMCVHCMQLSFCENGYHMFYHHELQENLWHLGGMVSPAPRLCLFGEGASLNCSETAKVLWVDGIPWRKAHQFGVNPPAILVALICPRMLVFVFIHVEPQKTFPKVSVSFVKTKHGEFFCVEGWFLVVFFFRRSPVFFP